MSESNNPDKNRPSEDGLSEGKERSFDGSEPTAAMPIEGRLAGIDFGTVRIGVAISDPSQTIASPLEVYNRRNIELDLKYFLELVELEQIAAFVVGLPVHMSGDASQKSKEAVAFGVWLHQKTELPVAWIDERYTTAMAREVLSHSNLSGKKRKAQLDKLAAQILLRAYLESDPHFKTGSIG
ncbi:MAG: Holliday junction resolvase RuvX [Mariniblastus sp.]